MTKGIFLQTHCTHYFHVLSGGVMTLTCSACRCFPHRKLSRPSLCRSFRDWVRDHLTFDNAGMVSVFETTIRVLGGLLSAFDLSGDKVDFRHAGDRYYDNHSVRFQDVISLCSGFCTTQAHTAILQIPYTVVNVLSYGRYRIMGGVSR